jgi:hypothetical protein
LRSDREDELSTTPPLPLGPAPAGGYGFSRDADENRRSVPIEQNSDWKVIYSVPLVDLAPGERVAVRGEVQLTTCQLSDLGNGPCQRVTPFDPKMKAKIVIGTSKGDANGPNLSNIAR